MGVRAVRCTLFGFSLMLAICAPAANFELLGELQPAQSLAVSLQGATSPFWAGTEADLSGKFKFRKLSAGAYVLTVGSVQRTVEIGPSLADSKGRVRVKIDTRQAANAAALESRNRVSVHELSVPKRALREYEDAETALNRRDVTAAIADLKRAVELAPQFSAAWNHLGTIAYQSGQYIEAEVDFRKALQADRGAFPPLVNLGGVLLNLAKWGEALEYNRRAVLQRPEDALANSQLGMAYFYSGQLALAEKYLTIAKQIDPAHFSHPQILLAEIHLRRNEPDAAADELEDLLKRHPDMPNASKIRQEIARLQAAAH